MLGAQAGLYYHYGIPKYSLPKKLFGVFPHTIIKKQSPCSGDLMISFMSPIPGIRKTIWMISWPARNLELLAVSDEAGVFAVKSENNRRFFITGHPEYDPDTLANEYFRDINKGLDIDVPKHYFPGDDPQQSPVVRWRSAASSFTQTGSITTYIRLLPMTCIKANCNDDKAGPRNLHFGDQLFVISNLRSTAPTHLSAPSSCPQFPSEAQNSLPQIWGSTPYPDTPNQSAGIVPSPVLVGCREIFPLGSFGSPL